MRQLRGRQRWLRFSEYELKDNLPHGQLGIAPAAGSTAESYRPFDYYPQILIDYLELASRITRHSTEQERREFEGIPFMGKHPGAASPETKDRLASDAAYIMAFCRKYGAEDLPAGWQSAYHRGKPLQQEPKRLTYIQRLARRHYEKELSRLAEPRPIEYWYPNCDRMISWSAAWQRFREGGFQPDAPYESRSGGRTWRMMLSGAYAHSVRIGIEYRNSWQIGYEFSSLTDALNIMFVLNVTSSEGPQIRFCKREECRKVFLAQNSRSLYCSDRCLNCDKVRRWRANNRRKNSS